ncbi:MAG TPA: hypothetical protein PKW08_01335 [Flavobacteriaceae bacterium]|nr:hypothetical protein [Flavobacteriaceae bacterium]MCB9212456.1 hypothetical protein [Alteromonas sp.]HPF11732.1 hypothetical protein [Flavobacteriaceae bacterium]HQU20207.1 hypothetical protein [Flavobacteriaceae bacterium]HQU64704.1 hypothetical protein [Flavobacteriaceae bacterium]
MKTLFKNLTIIAMLMIVSMSYGQDKRSLNNYREPSKDGINVFEAPKDTAVNKPFEGVKVRVGGSSALQFQAIDHENAFDPDTAGEGELPLKELSSNFNLATANLDLDVQLHDGLRMHLRTYLSSRHHPEPYVKGGYLQIDNLNFIQEGTLAELMKYVTVKVGHMEVNYGDMHFRRSDNSSALYNPFVGNSILDAFTTEVAGEVYFRSNGWIAMAGLTNGKLNQAPDNPKKTSPSVVAKLGYDKQINEDLRVRITGSIYNTAQAARVYLYSGDRAGARYYLVLSEEDASASEDFRTGRFDPGFRNEVTAIMFNPFIKYKGLEFFGMYETTTGRSDSDLDSSGNQLDRNWNQILVELLYRFGNNENFYIGGRYNTASGPMVPDGDDVTIDRINVGFGAFLTKNILFKVEYVSQKYDGFGTGSVYDEGKFSGAVVESVISF